MSLLRHVTILWLRLNRPEGSSIVIAANGQPQHYGKSFDGDFWFSCIYRAKRLLGINSLETSTDFKFKSLTEYFS